MNIPLKITQQIENKQFKKNSTKIDQDKTLYYSNRPQESKSQYDQQILSPLLKKKRQFDLEVMSQNQKNSENNSRIFDDNMSMISKTSNMTSKSVKQYYLRAVSVNNLDALEQLYQKEDDLRKTNKDLIEDFLKKINKKQEKVFIKLDQVYKKRVNGIWEEYLKEQINQKEKINKINKIELDQGVNKINQIFMERKEIKLTNFFEVLKNKIYLSIQEDIQQSKKQIYLDEDLQKRVYLQKQKQQQFKEQKKELQQKFTNFQSEIMQQRRQFQEFSDKQMENYEKELKYRVNTDLIKSVLQNSIHYLEAKLTNIEQELKDLAVNATPQNIQKLQNSIDKFQNSMKNKEAFQIIIFIIKKMSNENKEKSSTIIVYKITNQHHKLFQAIFPKGYALQPISKSILKKKIKKNQSKYKNTDHSLIEISIKSEEKKSTFDIGWGQLQLHILNEMMIDKLLVQNKEAQKVWVLMDQKVNNGEYFSIKEMTDELEIFLQNLQLDCISQKQKRDFSNIQHQFEKNKNSNKLQLEQILHKFKNKPIKVYPTTNSKNLKEYSSIQETKKQKEFTLSQQEKIQLSQNLLQLTHEQLRGVWNIACSDIKTNKTGKNHILFDLNKFAPQTLKEMFKYVNTKILSNFPKNEQNEPLQEDYKTPYFEPLKTIKPIKLEPLQSMEQFEYDNESSLSLDSL